MSSNLCKILLIEDDPGNANLIRNLLAHSDNFSLAQGLSFELIWVELLSQGIEELAKQSFDAILLDLRLPDSNGIDTLIEIKKYARQTPIIIQTGSADETLIVKSFQLGVGGYLKKENIDSNLLVYAIRSAIEKQNYIATVEQDRLQQQDLEVRELEQIANTVKTQVTARMFGSESLRESVPDIFVELVREYGNLMDLALEERAYKVEHNISEQLRILGEKLGFLKAGPRDVIDIHTKTLKEKNENVTLAKTQAYVSEGRLMVLELMGYLTSYYRKYYIGLNTMNLSFNPNLDRRDR